MAIVKLHPAFKDYIWGGTKLKELYNKKNRHGSPGRELGTVHTQGRTE